MRSRERRRNVLILLAAFAAALLWIPILVKLSPPGSWLDHVWFPLAVSFIVVVPFALFILVLLRFRFFSTFARKAILLGLALSLTAVSLFGSFLLFFQLRTSWPIRMYYNWKGERWIREARAKRVRDWNAGPPLARPPIDAGTFVAAFFPAFHPKGTVRVSSTNQGAMVTVEVEGQVSTVFVTQNEAQDFFKKLTEIHRVPADQEIVLDGCGLNVQITAREGIQIFQSEPDTQIETHPTERRIGAETLAFLRSLNLPAPQREYVNTLSEYFSTSPENSPF